MVIELGKVTEETQDTFVVGHIADNGFYQYPLG
jgi:hypothetical protein